MALPNHHGSRSPGDVQVARATLEQEPIVANLLELYCHDFSEFHDIRLRADGKFGYPNLPLYWTDPGRYPFLVRCDGKLVGLILVKRGSEFSRRNQVWDMAEFFVIRSHRRQGIGTAMAEQVWRQFPGIWEVRVMDANPAAVQFWRLAIEQFTGDPSSPERFDKDGVRWLLFSMEARFTA